MRGPAACVGLDRSCRWTRRSANTGTACPPGQRQRLALAALLRRGPRGEPVALLLDEPTAHLDPAAEQPVIEQLRAAAARGCAVLVVAHRPALLAAADRIVDVAAPDPADPPPGTSRTRRPRQPARAGAAGPASSRRTAAAGAQPPVARPNPSRAGAADRQAAARPGERLGGGLGGGGGRAGRRVLAGRDRAHRRGRLAAGPGLDPAAGAHPVDRRRARPGQRGRPAAAALRGAARLARGRVRAARPAAGPGLRRPDPAGARAPDPAPRRAADPGGGRRRRRRRRAAARPAARRLGRHRRGRRRRRRRSCCSRRPARRWRPGC